MFDNLTKRLSQSLAGLRGRRLTDDNILQATRDVRTALLEADVALEVVIEFIGEIQRKAVGQEFVQAVKPGDMFIKMVHDSLVEVMGSTNESLALATNSPPAVILMAGLQGAGKTTTCAKLAKVIKERDAKRVALVSADVYRPAAIEQLRTLSEDLDTRFIESDTSQKPVDIARNATKTARKEGLDVLIVDTAGRLAIDDDMMREIGDLHGVLKPAETLFVVDAMTGQDAANTAKVFSQRLDLTGVILAKTDGDARGGAALSVKAITKKPIKFLGVGEGMDGLEPFHPERIASRILGMGDILSLVEEAERTIDKKQAVRMTKKLLKGSRFDLMDMQSQIKQLLDMGGISKFTQMLPNMPNSKVKTPVEGSLRRSMVVIDSMTPRERQYPNLLNSSRKQRVARGSGCSIQDVNQTLRRFKQMEKQMKKVGKLGRRQNDVMKLLGDNPELRALLNQ